MRAPLRPLELVRAAWGAALLAAPGPLVRAVGGVAPDHRALVVARILGVRHLVQAVGSGADPGPAVLAVGAWVDGVHALTGVGLAVADPARRRVALVDTTIAGVFGALSRRDALRLAARGVDAHRASERLPWTERTAIAVLPLLPGAPRPAGPGLPGRHR